MVNSLILALVPHSPAQAQSLPHALCTVASHTYLDQPISLHHSCTQEPSCICAPFHLPPPTTAAFPAAPVLACIWVDVCVTAEGGGEGGSSFFKKARQKGSRWIRVRLPAEVSTNDTTRSPRTTPPGVDPADLAVAPTHRPWVQFTVTDKIRPGSIHSFRMR